MAGRPVSTTCISAAPIEGTRLNKLHRRDVDGDAIVAALSPLFESYASERDDGERFGDYVIRAGIVQRNDRRAELP